MKIERVFENHNSKFTMTIQTTTVEGHSALSDQEEMYNTLLTNVISKLSEAFEEEVQNANRRRAGTSDRS
jgi:hypothetical protein